MSYCQIITFSNGQPQHGPEFRNAWGGAARIWTSLFDRYLKDPSKPYDSWMTGSDKLWKLPKRNDLRDFERAVLASTFDRAYVSKSQFARFSNHLRDFAVSYPVFGMVDHLPAWSDWIEKSDADAVGFYGTSASENCWWEWEESKAESIPTPMSNGFEVYEWIESLSEGVEI